jgi:phenylacetate-CoA ligase
LWELQRAHHLGPEALHRLQSKKLRQIVEHAFATVPFYRQRWTRDGVHPDQVQTTKDLARLPVITKSELQATPEPMRLSSIFEREALIARRTSGSSGRPMTLFRDRAFEDHQKMVFLRALLAAGLRPWHRLLVVSGGLGETRSGLPGWCYVSSEEAPETMLAVMQVHRPQFIYGFLTPLRQLARLLRERGPPSRLIGVITTAETLDSSTRALLADSFQAEVFDIYGCTEAGPLAWECKAHSGYHLAAETTVVECVNTPSTEPGQVVLTSLELRGMPLIRYAVGDLAVTADGGRCTCGSCLPRLARLEGRLVDCIQLPGGRLLSPYHLTLALEQIGGLARYQIVQENIDRFLVRAQGTRGADIDRRIAAALHGLFGISTDIEVRWEADLEPPPGRKFRVVECRLPAEAACAY